MADEIEVILADLTEPDHAAAVLEVIEDYARGVMGESGLSEEVLSFLVPGLREHPTHLVFLARRGTRLAGAAVCFVGYSTFAAKPLVNVHDLAVLPGERRHGVGQALLSAVEAWARTRGCCKLTLEVRADNAAAMALYDKSGYRNRDSAGGQETSMLFWHKPL